ncbi:hypothetical protein VNI00_007483 [Paramarasmius palmivorus]|uniref:Uncharacterized protein n=1 Tax=Paramarasmius palmivorus TaxID=297713 RepID=A0AAW0D4H0_9AGAR
MSSSRDKNELLGFCNAETIQKALQLIPIARSKTHRSAGYNVPANAVVPICAYLASQQIQNNDVDMEAARNKASMNAKDFRNLCNIVQGLLEGELAEKKRKRRDKVTYDALIQEYTFSKSSAKVKGWLAEVEEELAELGRTGFDRTSTEVKCGVFLWVYGALEVRCTLQDPPKTMLTRQNMQERNAPDMKEFASANGVEFLKLRRIYNDLDTYLTNLRKKIVNEYNKSTNSPNKLPLPSTTPTNTPRRANKRALRPVITGDSPKRPRLAETPVEKEQLPSPPPAQPEFEPKPGSSKDVDMAPAPPLPKTPSKRMIGPFATPSSRRTVKALDTLKGQATGSESPTRTSTRRTPANPKVTTRPESPLLETPSRSSRLVREPITGRSESPSRSTRKVQPLLVEDNAMDVDSPSSEDENEQPDTRRPSGRRFRPVFQDRKQWVMGDQRLNKIWADAEKQSRKRMEKFGFPFERYKSDAGDDTDSLFG